MPRFYFHIHDGREISDAEGTELTDLNAARLEAVKLAGRMLDDHPAEFWNSGEWRIEVADETGRRLFNLVFKAQDVA